ncbi:hypothetical protein [uncultured Jatrophihabitans sp.]|uniref:hypothetical protein n=1 Tax=uncultured Jatrophihabitans sp. TaxID=1610747 RepID=UPI0035C94F14
MTAPRRIATAALALILTFVAGTAASNAAALPNAHLHLRVGVPAQHYSAAPVGGVHLRVGKITETTCRIANSGPATVTHLHVRLAFQTATPKRWTVRLHRHGKARTGGAVQDVGTVKKGQTRTVRLFVTPRAHSARQLTITCGADPSRTVEIVQPRYDRAGDTGAALRLHPRRG